MTVYGKFPSGTTPFVDGLQSVPPTVLRGWQISQMHAGFALDFDRLGRQGRSAACWCMGGAVVLITVSSEKLDGKYWAYEALVEAASVYRNSGRTALDRLNLIRQINFVRDIGYCVEFSYYNVWEEPWL